MIAATTAVNIGENNMAVLYPNKPHLNNTKNKMFKLQVNNADTNPKKEYNLTLSFPRI